MAWSWNDQPTGEFKFEEGVQSPNGKAITLKGVRAVPHPVVASDQDPVEFNSGLTTFFQIFGMTMPSSSTIGGIRGVRISREDLKNS